MFVFSRRDVNYEFLVHYRPCIYGEKLFRERGSPFQLSQLKREYVWEKVHPFAWAKSWLLFILSLFERVDPAGQVKGPLPFSPKFRKILVRNQPFNATDHFGLVRREYLRPLLKVEVCMAEGLTPWTLDLEIWGASVTCHVVSLDEEVYSTLSPFNQVYKWVPVTYCWRVTLQWPSISSRGEKQYS